MDDSNEDSAMEYCQATTKRAGKQCTRRALAGAEYCWQHAPKDPPIRPELDNQTQKQAHGFVGGVLAGVAGNALWDGIKKLRKSDWIALKEDVAVDFHNTRDLYDFKIIKQASQFYALLEMAKQFARFCDYQFDLRPAAIDSKEGPSVSRHKLVSFLWSLDKIRVVHSELCELIMWRVYRGESRRTIALHYSEITRRSSEGEGVQEVLVLRCLSAGLFELAYGTDISNTDAEVDGSFVGKFATLQQLECWHWGSVFLSLAVLESAYHNVRIAGYEFGTALPTFHL